MCDWTAMALSNVQSYGSMLVISVSQVQGSCISRRNNNRIFLERISQVCFSRLYVRICWVCTMFSSVCSIWTHFYTNCVALEQDSSLHIISLLNLRFLIGKTPQWQVCEARWDDVLCFTQENKYLAAGKRFKHEIALHIVKT